MEKMERVISGIQSGDFDEALQALYLTEAEVAVNKARYVRVIGEFEKIFGNREIEVYSAPGRTEICGNHTDHQGGKVLAAAINLDAIAVVAKREDENIRFVSEGYGEIAVSLDKLEPVAEENGKTQALIRGVANGIKKRGFEIGGFDAYVSSQVLSGSGLSSSAAIEVLIGSIFSGLYNEQKVDVVTLAQIGQEAESTYFGKPCGLMDQMACAVGGLICIDFKDEKMPVYKKLSADFNEYHYAICIVDTKGSHANLTDEYAAVPVEMRKVASFFGRTLLKEVSEDEFYQNIPGVREAAGDRAVLRAIHWFSENRRVESAVEALESGHFEQFLETIQASGHSSFQYLQNVYSVKDVTKQEVAVGLALSDSFLAKKGVCRVHGGGFAGTMQAFVPNDMVNDYVKRMKEIYGEDSCYILSVRPMSVGRIL